MIRFDRPAADWNEALPIGNGRLGGMVFSTVGREQIQLNEESLWYGGFRDRNNPDALAHLGEIRGLIREGRIAEAERLSAMALAGTPESQRHYQPLGDLFVTFDAGEKDVSGYRRTLDIATATAAARYGQNGIAYARTYIASAVDQCIVVRLEADGEAALSFRAVLRRGRYLERTEKEGGDSLVLRGSSGGDGGIRFCTRLRAVAEGGAVRTIGETIEVRGARSATLFLSASTSFRTPEYERECADWVERASLRSWPEILHDHVADYGRLYARVGLELSGDGPQDPDDVTTAERLQRLKAGAEDPDLAATYFQFGRYLLISSSRPGCLPATLQGIWNREWVPPWDSKYTININTEMNYWPAEVTNLPELHEPLFEHIERMRPHGRETARVMYGCRGFTAHHNTDLWGDTAPQDVWIPGSFWPMGAAWLCLHLWHRYEMSLDREFLAAKYGTMKEAAEFFLDFLEEDPKGRLVTNPSVSPENTYILPNGERGSMCMGASMDSQIIRELMENCVRASKILDVDAEAREVFRRTAARLPRHEIGKHGQLMEWSEDYEEAEPGHRHVSHLFALYPGREITVRGTPELARAARTSLERRLAHGGGHTGWSRAWIINLWARLEDGRLVGENVNALLASSTLPNLLDNHPPFQIDGNFGGTAGIAEALLQSHGGEIHLLPALPPAWKSGNVTGLRARGAYEVGIGWKDGRLEWATIRSDRGGRPTVRYGEATVSLRLDSGREVRLGGGLRPV